MSVSEISPKVSVITAFLNAEAFLVEAIESILNQTLQDFEFILIDDGSTDRSEEIAKRYASQDARIIYQRNEKRMGKVYNLNLGIALSHAELLAIFDGDDVSEPTRLEKEYNFLTLHPEIAIVGSFVKIINAQGEIIGERTKLTDPQKIFQTAVVYSPVLQPSVMYRKSAILALGAYREEFAHGQDLDLWLRATYSGYKLSNIPEYLLRYRYHQHSTAHSSTSNAVRDFQMRKSIIRDFGVKLSAKQVFLVYAQLMVGVCFSGRQRQFLEGLYKKIFYGKK